MTSSQGDIWKALADDTRREILDLLREKPRTTNEIVSQFPHLSRFGVMKHIDVLRRANLILAEKRGRERINSLNAIPVQMIYERWVKGYAKYWAEQLTELKKGIEGG